MESRQNDFYSQGNLYVVDLGGGCVKIGRSENVAKRMRCVVTQSPDFAVNTHVSERCSDIGHAERTVHKELSFCRKKHEWFSISFAEAVEIVDKIVACTNSSKNFLSANTSGAKEIAKELVDMQYRRMEIETLKSLKQDLENITAALRQKGYDVTVRVRGEKPVVVFDNGDEMLLDLFIELAKNGGNT